MSHPPAFSYPHPRREEASDEGESSSAPGPRPIRPPGPMLPPAMAVAPEQKPEPELDWISEAQLPLTHEAILKGHTKTVCSLDLDPPGARLITGSADYSVKFWDFGGMDERLQYFRSVEPFEGHQVSQLAWSRDGQRFLVCASSAQPKIYDRDGRFVNQFVKGDQYLMQMKDTKGHVAEVTSMMWHPTDSEKCITASLDSTVRIWEVEEVKRSHTSLIRARNAQNKKVGITVAAIPPSDLKWVAAGCADGSIQIWDGKNLSPFHTAKIVMRGAHSSHQLVANMPPDNPISCLKFKRGDQHTLVSRCCDGTVKVWDIRNPRCAVAAYEGYENIDPRANMTFSPDGQYLVLGTSCPPKQPELAQLVVLDAQSWSAEPIGRMPLNAGAVVRVEWSERTNQVVVGCGDGTVRVLYSPTTSQHGALLCVKKAKPKAELVVADIGEGEVYAPHALPMFKEERVKSKKRQREKDRKDPVKSHRPELPMVGPGHGGRVGSSATSYLVKQMGNLTERKITTENARERFLRHADITDEFTQSFTAVYAKNQPEKVYDLSYLDEEEDGGGGAQ